jgi:hypothetical protein
MANMVILLAVQWFAGKEGCLQLSAVVLGNLFYAVFVSWSIYLFNFAK